MSASQYGLPRSDLQMWQFFGGFGHFAAHSWSHVTMNVSSLPSYSSSLDPASMSLKRRLTSWRSSIGYTNVGGLPDGVFQVDVSVAQEIKTWKYQIDVPCVAHLYAGSTRRRQLSTNAYSVQACPMTMTPDRKLFDAVDLAHATSTNLFWEHTLWLVSSAFRVLFIK